jgi:hypothetical protein
MQSFYIDKSVNAIVEGLAADVIRGFWANQGKKVSVTQNRHRILEDEQEYDAKDSLGYLWEVKSDVACWHTGNVFVEESVHHSTAHFYLIFAQGRPWILERQALCELANSLNSRVRGGDDLRAVGTLVPLPAIEQLAINK